MFKTVFLGCAIVVSACNASSPSQLKDKREIYDPNRYDALIQQARVMDRSFDPSSVDVIEGPYNQSYLQAEVIGEDIRIPEVDCTFRETSDGDLGGTSPKFECRYRDGDKKIDLKVKYDLDGSPYNGEIYSEVAATRLLWLLGFKADNMYPAIIHCKNCPDDPFGYIKHPELRNAMPLLRQVTFDKAAVELKIKGDDIRLMSQNNHNQEIRRGWGFDEPRR